MAAAQQAEARRHIREQLIHARAALEPVVSVAEEHEMLISHPSEQRLGLVHVALQLGVLAEEQEVAHLAAIDRVAAMHRMRGLYA